jgi:YjbR
LRVDARCRPCTVREDILANYDDFRRLALSLEGVTEAPHFDRLAFRVARTFATLAADRKTANIKFSPDEQEFKCMLAPEAFSPLDNAWGRRGWTLAQVSALSEGDLRAALEAAWRHAQKIKPTRSRRIS